MKIFKQFAILGALIALLGITSSCSNDNIEIKSPTKLGYVELSAALPEGSRVVLGDDTADTTPVYWEADDTIVITIGGEEYTFAIKEFVAEQTSALFYSESAPTELEAGTYTATYKATTTAEQSGLKEDIENYQPMTAEFAVAEGEGWDDVTLNFDSSVAVLKLTLSNDAFKGAEVSGLKLRNNGTVVATATSTFAGDESGTIVAYFAVEPQSFSNTTIEVVSGEKYYLATLADNIITAGDLYQISKIMSQKFTTSIEFTYTADSKVTLTEKPFGNAAYDHTFADGNGVIKVDFSGGKVVIADGAFADAAVKTLVIPEGVVAIGSNSFRENATITEVTIPASVTAIGNTAFYSCTNLKKVSYYGTTPPQASSNAFSACYNLFFINVPADYTGSVCCGKMVKNTL